MVDQYIRYLNERGVQVKDIAECVYFLQEKYIEDLTIETCVEAVLSVLKKREVQNAILTGVYLDKKAETDMEDKLLKEMLLDDHSLYGIDEVLAYGICNLYGSIALTNYGYIDKVKPGIIGELNKKQARCHTFMDDIVGAIAASAASRIDHNR